MRARTLAAAISAGVDFIATDRYEDLTRLLAAKRCQAVTMSKPLLAKLD